LKNNSGENDRRWLKRKNVMNINGTLRELSKDWKCERSKNNEGQFKIIWLMPQVTGVLWSVKEESHIGTL